MVCDTERINLVRIGSEIGRGKKVLQTLNLCHKYKKLQRHLEDRAKLRELETIISTDYC